MKKKKRTRTRIEYLDTSFTLVSLEPGMIAATFHFFSVNCYLLVKAFLDMTWTLPALLYMYFVKKKIT